VPPGSPAMPPRLRARIVGDDVATQLAGDYLKAQLKDHRTQQPCEPSTSVSTSSVTASGATSPTRP
jgi:isopropylmalate/homocitrate/citramalate synthase